MKKSELLTIADLYGANVYKSWTNARIVDAIEARRLELLRAVKRDIEHHDKHKNSYFWSPPTSANQRRRAEKHGSYTHEFDALGFRYTYRATVSCSCKNYYYTGEFYENDEQKNVRAWRQLVSFLEIPSKAVTK